jgi:hypothetical protein
MHSVLTVGVRRACSSVRPREAAKSAVCWYSRRLVMQAANELDGLK